MGRYRYFFPFLLDNGLLTPPDRSMKSWRRFLKPSWLMLWGAVILMSLWLASLRLPGRNMALDRMDVAQMMQKGTIQSVMSDGTEYQFHAQQALPSDTDPQIWELDTLNAQWDIKSGAYHGWRILAQSPTGRLYQQDRKLLLPNRLIVTNHDDADAMDDELMRDAPTPWQLHTANVMIDFAAQTLRSKAPAIGTSSSGRVRGDSIALDHRAKLLQFLGQVRSTMIPSTNAPAAQNPDTDTTSTNPAPLDFRTEPEAPIHIRAPQLLVEYAQQRATYMGGVFVQQGPLDLRADNLQLYFMDNPTEFSHFEAQGNIVLTSGDQMATGQWLRYEAAADEMIMGDAVRLTQQDTQLTGNEFVVRLSQGSGTLRATTQANRRVRAQFFIPTEPAQNHRQNP